MSKVTGESVSVKIIPNEQATPAGKLADAEVIFEGEAGPLSGLKLIGFAVWERRDGGRNVTFPARQYSVNGERRGVGVVRPTEGGRSRKGAVRASPPGGFSPPGAPPWGPGWFPPGGGVFS